MAQVCEIEMDGTSASIRRARAFVEATLSSWGLDELKDRAVLLTSELATNAVLHARTRFRVTMVLDGDLTVEVTDGSETLPEPESLPLDGDRGRGLFLVAELASQWGSRREDRGKTVWFTLVADPAPVDSGAADRARDTSGRGRGRSPS